MMSILHSTIGHYRTLEKVGEGGMGEVYRARDENLGREVAIKVLASGMLADEKARQRFHKEAVTLSKLNHPNIATIYDFDAQGGIDFLVMEYAPGMTLSDKLQVGPLAEREIVGFGTQLSEGLGAAHSRGVLHCDVKPGNLRITPEGQLKILDFGLARLVPAVRRAAAGESSTETTTAPFAGTLPYMAPEQLRGEHVDARTDLYAAGVVLYEMATGQPPFHERLSTALADQILHEPPPAPGRLQPRLSGGFERIILKCLEKQPARRYQSANELLADLRVIQNTAKYPPALRWARRWAAAGVGIVLVVLLATFLSRLNVGDVRRRFHKVASISSSSSSPTLEISEVVRRSTPSLVLIQAKETSQGMAVGSGFVADSGGLVISSLHIFENATAATVKADGGAEFDNPVVAGFDPERDLIAIRIASPAFPSLPLDRSGGAQVGDRVVVIGNPAGLSGSVSDGIIASVRETEKGMLYQITAPVSPGSSGGPVLNMRGEVIGIIAFTVQTGQNLNFAVPIRYALPLLEHPLSLTLAQLSTQLQGGSHGSVGSRGRSALTASEQYRRGLDLYKANKPREAVEAFEKAINLDPSQGEPYVQIGSILAEDPNSRDQAISYLKEGLKFSAEDSVAHSLLAVLYREDRRYGDSISESKKAIAISPMNPAFHLVLATSLEESQRCEEAVGELRESIRLRPNYANAYYHLALCQEKAGTEQTAKQSWQTYLNLAGQTTQSSDQVRIAREHLSRIGK